jgi:hypothetical protein
MRARLSPTSRTKHRRRFLEQLTEVESFEQIFLLITSGAVACDKASVLEHMLPKVEDAFQAKGSEIFSPEAKPSPRPRSEATSLRFAEQRTQEPSESQHSELSLLASEEADLYT